MESNRSLLWIRDFFLIESIKEIVGDKNVQTMTYKEKENLKEDIVKRVYGIDINPLSVLSARVGYYLALKPFGNLHDIDIPVFLGDSAILAEEISLDGTKCYKYSVNNLKKRHLMLFYPKDMLCFQNLKS